MPNENAEDPLHLQTRSALRHRPISTGPAMNDQVPPRIQRASRIRATTDETKQNQEQGQTRDTDTAEPFLSPPDQAGIKLSPKPGKQLIDDPLPKSKREGRFRTIPNRTRIIILGAAGIVAMLILMFLYQQITMFATTTWDDIHYGRPRTFQIDAFVGHESGKNPSHFIAINLQGRIEILELPGGDASNIHVYAGPQLVGNNADLIPPTLQFVSIPNSKLKDMILEAGNVEIYYHNVQGTFRSS